MGGRRDRFTFARSAACADAFAHQLLARGAIDEAHTIVAGHSMGGAIAVIVGARMPVAGVVAISPAPMTAAHGIPAFMLPFDNPPATPANTLAITGTFEPAGIRATAQDLVRGAPGGSGKFVRVPRSSHVSVLFDSACGASCAGMVGAIAASAGWCRCAFVPAGGGLVCRIRWIVGADRAVHSRDGGSAVGSDGTKGGYWRDRAE